MKSTYRKSWASNFLLWSDLTFGLSFKVKQWFTDFGELFFRWIQFCIGSPMRRSSFYPTALKGCRGIVLTHGVRMGRRANGRKKQEKVCPGRISETVRCRKFIRGRDISQDV